MWTSDSRENRIQVIGRIEDEHPRVNHVDSSIYAIPVLIASALPSPIPKAMNICWIMQLPITGLFPSLQFPYNPFSREWILPHKLYCITSLLKILQWLPTTLRFISKLLRMNYMLLLKLNMFLWIPTQLEFLIFKRYLKWQQNSKQALPAAPSSIFIFPFLPYIWLKNSTFQLFFLI